MIGVQASSKQDIIDLHNKCYSLFRTNFDSAIIVAENAKELASDEAYTYLEAQSLYIKAYAFNLKEDQGKAFITYLESLQLLNQTNNTEAVELKTDLILSISSILMKHNAYSEAIQYLNEGIEIAESYNLREKKLSFSYNKSLSLRHKNDLGSALKQIEYTLKLAIELDDELRVLRSINQKGLILKDLKQYQQARETYSEIIQFDFEKQNPEKYIGQAWHNIAVTFLDENNLEKAKAAYLKAIISKESRNKAEDLFITYQDLAETLLNLNEINGAYSYAQKCDALYDQCDLDPDNYKFFNLMSEIAYRQNKPKLVRKYSQKYFDENEKFLTQQREILEVKDRYKMEVLTAGFFSELHADQNISLLERVLWTVGILFTCILLITRIYTYLRKRSLSIQIAQIKEEGSV